MSLTQSGYSTVLRRIVLLLLTLFVWGILSESSYARKNELRVTVSNPSSFSRNNETIVLPWTSLTAKLSTLTKKNIVVIDGKSGSALLSQLGEGEVLFQSSFGPNETKSFIVRNGRPKVGRPRSLVDGRFVEPRRDYAWENDRIAFRMYGPALAKEVNNGIDVWTKRVRHLIVEKWYKGEADTGAAKRSYHVDHGEGADFFSVGKTLGAGSCGLWYNDRVYQPGVFSSYRTIANGPIRLIFELLYDSLIVEGRRFREVKRITLDAGQHLNTIEATYIGVQPGEEIQVVVGLVKRKEAGFFKEEKEGWISLWGPTNADTVNGSLGTGVVMSTPAYEQILEDNDHHLIRRNARVGRSVTYYAGAGWTRAGDFKTEQEWKEYLSRFALSLQSPLKVQIGR